MDGHLCQMYIFCLGLISLLTGTVGEICTYRKYEYDEWFQQYQTSTRYKYCAYGCCGVNLLDQYCCKVPVGLIIGCSVGAVGIIAVAIICGICCCCVCSKSSSRGNGQVIRGPAVVFHTAHSNSQSVDIIDAQNAPPPSYEEVMAGQDNYAFKAT